MIINENKRMLDLGEVFKQYKEGAISYIELAYWSVAQLTPEEVAEHEQHMAKLRRAQVASMLLDSLLEYKQAGKMTSQEYAIGLQILEKGEEHKLYRTHECWSCKTAWDSSVVWSAASVNLSGDPGSSCPKCGKKSDFASEVKEDK